MVLQSAEADGTVRPSGVRGGSGSVPTDCRREAVDHPLEAIPLCVPYPLRELPDSDQ